MSHVLRRASAVYLLALAVPAASQSPSSPAPISGTASHPVLPGHTDGAPLDTTAAVTAKLLGLAREWVRTWNEKDVDRMQQLHDDNFVYGIFGHFVDGQDLLKEIQKQDFWGVTYTLKMVKPQVRVLSSDTALVLFQLVGKSVGPKGERPYASLFTLVYQKRGGDWKIIHVHDSESSECSLEPTG